MAQSSPSNISFHNLPVQPTPLIGREQEIETICTLLKNRDVRLVTLVGPGGVGKTRLGLEVASQLEYDFADGVCFVSLAALNDHELVSSTIARTLGLREAGDAGNRDPEAKPLLPSLKIYVREKRFLLLLDNFEQVVSAAPCWQNFWLLPLD